MEEWTVEAGTSSCCSFKAGWRRKSGDKANLLFAKRKNLD